MKIIFNWVISIVIILTIIPGILIETILVSNKSDLFIKADYLKRERNLSYSYIISLMKEEILLGIIMYLVIGLLIRGL